MPEIPGFENVFKVAEAIAYNQGREKVSESVSEDKEDLSKLEFQGLAGDVVDGYGDLFVSEAKRRGENFVYPVVFVDPEKGMSTVYKYFYLGKACKERPVKGEVLKKRKINGQHVFEYFRTGGNGVKSIVKNMDRKYRGKKMSEVVRETFQKEFKTTEVGKELAGSDRYALFVDLCVVGQVITESKYNPDVNSDGLWQITAVAKSGSGNLNNPIDSTKNAVKVYNENFRALKPVISNFCEKFCLDFKSFLIPVLICAYQSGQGRAQSILSWAEKFKEQDIKTFLGTQKGGAFSKAFGVFMYISGNYYVDAKSGKNGANKRYREVSVNYVPKVFGITKAFKDFESKAL